MKRYHQGYEDSAGEWVKYDDCKKLIAIVDSIYPAIAGLSMRYRQNGEVIAAEKWDAYCREINNAREGK